LRGRDGEAIDQLAARADMSDFLEGILIMVSPVVKEAIRAVAITGAEA
jgi:hypothetical protein